MKNDWVLLFDLDDTLLIEEESAFNAILAAANILLDYDVDPVRFANTVKEKAREIWRGLPTYQYCSSIGISSWEGLWANFTGKNNNQKKLKELKEYYHFNSWNNALKKYGINSSELAKKLSIKFNEERRKRHILFPEAGRVLDKLSNNYRMGLITNGTPDLQWEKINDSNIKKYFEKIIISGEVDVRKPKKEIFEYAFNYFKEPKKNYIMIGNSLKSDISGALNAGIKSIWINRNNEPDCIGVTPDIEIRNLNEIFSKLNKL